MRSPETFGLIFFNILDIVVRRALRPRFARPRLAHHPSTRGADTFMLPSACTERARVAERSEATPRVEVGVDRLELSTFRLSSECSNQLSYTPLFDERTNRLDYARLLASWRRVLRRGN